MTRAASIALRILPLVALLGCASAHVAPSPDRIGRTIAILPPNNRTGDPLLVTGASLFERYGSASPPVTVSDVLAAEARVRLQRLGFSILDPEQVAQETKGKWPTNPSHAAAIAHRANLDAAVLYIEIRRWEADRPTHPSYVIIGIEMNLVDSESGDVLWSARRAASPIATPAEVNLGSAYVYAAKKVTEGILARAE